jgi:predicted aspartyl protease
MVPSQEILELAKRGDPKAIATLINQSLQPKGITARVTRKDACLRVLMEADEIPNQQALSGYLQRNLENLGISTITTVELQGKQACAAAPAWRQSFHLATSVLPLSHESQVVSDLSIASPFPSVSPKLNAATNFGGTTPIRLKTNAQRIYQIAFSGIIAFILILLGANLRSAQTLFAKSQTPKKVALDVRKGSVYQAPIISRIRGVPIIMVTFNGSSTFPMIVDTGAAGTLITQRMASTLGVKPVSQATAQTANGYTTFDVGYVNSIEVDGARVSNVAVAIGLSDMNFGLLGHDFFNSFDVTVRQNVVEFRPREEEGDGKGWKG